MGTSGVEAVEPTCVPFNCFCTRCSTDGYNTGAPLQAIIWVLPRLIAVPFSVHHPSMLGNMPHVQQASSVLTMVQAQPAAKVLTCLNQYPNYGLEDGQGRVALLA